MQSIKLVLNASQPKMTAVGLTTLCPDGASTGCDREFLMSRIADVVRGWVGGAQNVGNSLSAGPVPALLNRKELLARAPCAGHASFAAPPSPASPTPSMKWTPRGSVWQTALQPTCSTCPWWVAGWMLRCKHGWAPLPHWAPLRSAAARLSQGPAPREAPLRHPPPPRHDSPGWLCRRFMGHDSEGPLQSVLLSAAPCPLICVPSPASPTLPLPALSPFSCSKGGWLVLPTVDLSAVTAPPLTSVPMARYTAPFKAQLPACAGEPAGPAFLADREIQYKASRGATAPLMRGRARAPEEWGRNAGGSDAAMKQEGWVPPPTVLEAVQGQPATMPPCYNATLLPFRLTHRSCCSQTTPSTPRVWAWRRSRCWRAT